MEIAQDIKNAYRNASFVANNRVVFNIKGNDQWLIVAVAYQVGIVYVKFIGTHAEYEQIDAATIGLTEMNISPIRTPTDDKAALK
ncbi:type II toxin-antitoxin system HigB family toxin [Stenotrophomonas sp. 364]|uniref:type II toxin-antitoxin system HigB family toxin n=1 Tax=Stenotrophomonas sp. 364 TaxID=2691571 RepID=UPI0019150E10|nr:type II toxin-antitoxin system HigB family toxin [Stenotrophomonas sp. 364]